MANFELMEFREPAFEPGESFPGTQEQQLGVFEVEADAIKAGRIAWKAFRESGSHDVAWWIVRVPGESLARWLADSASTHEKVLDLTTNELVEIE